MSERGVIALDRGIFTDPDFAPEPFTEREAFIWLVAEAAWKQREARGQAGRLTLERGELCHSVRFMAEAWKWSKSRVDRFIKRLLKTGTLVEVSRDREKVYFVKNYNRFQTVGLPKRDKSGTASGTAAGQQRDKLEDIKTLKETTTVVSENADERATILAEVMDAAHADAVNTHRKLKGAKSWTEVAAGLLAKEFAKVTAAGFDPNEAADAMIRNGWQGFEADWFLRSKRPALSVVTNSRSPPPKPKSVGQRMGDRMLNRSTPPEPENDWRTIDGLATRN